MPNTFTNVKEAAGIIAKAAAKEFHDTIAFGKAISKADESDFDGKNGYKAGDTIYINKPPVFIPQNTFDITSSKQDVLEQTAALPLDIISTIGIEVNSFEFATEIDLRNTYNRYVKPMIQSLAHDVDQQMIEKATKNTFNVAGTPGSTVYDTDTILQSRELMNKYLCPKDMNRHLLLDSTASRSAINARKGLFNDQEALAKQYREGSIGRADGFAWHESELLYSHTNGNDVTGVTVKTTVSAQGATTMVLTGLTTTTGTVTAGSTFTVANVKAVHPITKQVYTFNQRFTVITGGTADGSGDLTVTVYPAMYTTGSRKTIDAFPQGTAAVTFDGAASTAYTQQLAFHKNAFRMASVPLIMPTKAELAVQETYEGYTVAIIRDFDVNTRSMITRVDFLGGLCPERPEWACRLPA